MMTKNEEHWRVVIKSFEDSGLGPGEFCKKQGISGSRFRFYRKKFRDEAQSSPPTSKNSFEPLIIRPSPITRTNFKLVVELPNKIRCELAAVDSSHQMALLRELMTLC
jgi:hypothetical protein